MDWLPLNLNEIPRCPGVYGFLSGEDWLYIGKAQNLAKRLSQRHPALSVALSLEMAISYWYIPSESPTRLEQKLIKDLLPAWNGSTSYEDMSEKHLYAAHGVFCNVYLDNREAFLKTLYEMGTLHPQRLTYYSDWQKQRILNQKPCFERTPVNQADADEALRSLWG